jgi:hypothetical protein
MTQGYERASKATGNVAAPSGAGAAGAAAAVASHWLNLLEGGTPWERLMAAENIKQMFEWGTPEAGLVRLLELPRGLSALIQVC